MTDSKRAAALELASAGFRVFPLAINGKTPAITGDWQKVATTDPDKIDRLWRDPAFDSEIDFNIGIALDRHTVVIDVDTRDGKRGRKSLALIEAINDDLPNTLTVITASGGEHRYFTTNDSGNFPAHLAEHIDIKGEGGYVVGPGSSIDGCDYRTQGEGGRGEIAMAPRWLRDYADAGRKPADRRLVAGDPLGETDTAAAIERAKAYLANAPGSGTFQIAARVKDFGISEQTCLDLMLEHWRDAQNLDKDDDHVEFRVANAYRYGSSPVGVANPEAEFDAVDITSVKPSLSRRGLYALPWRTAEPELDQNYLVEDVIDRGTMAVTYGDSNVGKTYVVLDQAVAIAAGTPWNGHAVHHGLVVYVIAEGGSGFIRRVAAYKKDRQLADLPFAIVPCSVDLFTREGLNDTSHLIRLIRDVERENGQKAVLVVIDTLARAMGGGDENTATDMGVFVINCDRIRAATGATVNLIHHTGKDASKGARGSSALRAATDTEIEVSRGHVAVQKQRDMEIGKPMAFDLRPIEIGKRPDGKVVTACVVDWVAQSEFEARVSPDATAMLERFNELLEAAKARVEETGEGTVFVTWADWKMSALSGFESAKGKRVSESYLFKLREELLTSGLVERTKQKQWVSGKTHQTHL